MLGIAWKVNEIKHSENVNFTEEYYIGSRGMGGLVLAMTIVATYVGASSFIGGPGVAYKLDLVGYFLLVFKFLQLFLLLGFLEKNLLLFQEE